MPMPTLMEFLRSDQQENNTWRFHIPVDLHVPWDDAGHSAETSSMAADMAVGVAAIGIDVYSADKLVATGISTALLLPPG